MKQKMMQQTMPYGHFADDGVRKLALGPVRHGYTFRRFA
jgi:hypothetical protein